MTLNRRKFCTAVGAVLAARTGRIAWAEQGSRAYKIVVETDRRRILQSAEQYLPMEPVTVTSFRSPKSPGGPHDSSHKPTISGRPASRLQRAPLARGSWQRV